MPGQIRRLKIERFRGVKSLTWYPCPGLNVIIGGGDVGKTTILDAIALLLHPSNTYALMDTDYWRRDVESEFTIEAVMSLSEDTGVSQQSKMNWPWEWDEEKPVLPLEGGDDGVQREPVYVLRVRGTADMELVYEMVQPDGSVDPLSVSLRRAIGIVRLAGDDRNDRDLRLVQGSGLDRLLADKGLRGRLSHQLAAEDVKDRLKDQAKDALTELETQFGQRALPTNLGLGITGGPGISLNALVGLTAEKDGVTLPLASWGAGTRRLCALAIADTLRRERPITVVDEIERGLEPYRQRALIKDLKAGGSQVFVTTHSAAVLAAASDASIWYLDAKGNLERLPNEKIKRHLKSDPETFLARLAVVCEGATECGFTSVLLERAIGDFLDYGVWITDGGGNDSTRDLLDALADGGLTFAGMVDNEGRGSGRWERIKKVVGDLLIQWPDGCLEEHVIPLFDRSVLPQLIADLSGERTGERLRTLAARLEIADADWSSIEAYAGEQLVRLIIEAATGKVPEKFAARKGEFKAHARVWFKSIEGGRELAEKVFSLGAWPRLQPEILPFINAIRQTIGLDPIKELRI